MKIKVKSIRAHLGEGDTKFFEKQVPRKIRQSIAEECWQELGTYGGLRCRADYEFSRESK